jgi:hypothetical protein
MKLTLSLFCLGLGLAAARPSLARAPQAVPLSRPFKIRVLTQGGGFSVDLPVVARTRGFSTTFFTSLDITNNTAQPTDVDFSYTPADGSATRSGSFGTLLGFDNIHTEDVLLSLASAGILPPGQAENTFGTMLLTFDNAAFHTGNEATAVARVWSFASGSAGPTTGTAYRAQPLHTAGAHVLAGLVRNGEGLMTSIGVENVGIDDAGDPVDAPLTVRLTFFDPGTGAPVGTQPTFALAPGQMTQISNILDVDGTNSFQLPPDATSLIVFVEAVAGTSQINGYVVWKDRQTNDGAFVHMQESVTPF